MAIWENNKVENNSISYTERINDLDENVKL